MFDSLGARILDCFLRVSGKASLDAFCKDLTWQELNEYAREVVRQFADARVVHKLRRAREKDGKDSGDMVFENAVLALRDSLALREFTDAIKAGDSGRVVLILKLWALMYRGSERTKYAHEVLFLVHNLTHVWPEGLRYEVRILFRIRI